MLLRGDSFAQKKFEALVLSCLTAQEPKVPNVLRVHLTVIR